MIKALVTDYDTLLSLLDHFYTSYEVQWMYDNKPHGFDIIDLRLGGLRQRIVHCMKRLQAYVDGKLTRIEELEEPVLDCCCIENAEAKPLNRARFWNEIATANVIDVVLLNRQRIFCRNTQKCASQKSPPNAYRKQLTYQ